MTLRDEGGCRGWQLEQGVQLRGGDTDEHGRLYDDEAPIARAGDAGLRRPGLQEAGEAVRAKHEDDSGFTNRQRKRKHFVDDAIKAQNRTKSLIRLRVEHSIGVIHRAFGLRYAGYSRTAKNGNRLFVTRRWRKTLSSDLRSWGQAVCGRDMVRSKRGLSTKLTLRVTGSR